LHDDRLDAVEGAVRYWQQFIAQDQAEAVKRQRDAEYQKFIKDPLNHNRYNPPTARKGILARFKR
jgi:hypothetical protein